MKISNSKKALAKVIHDNGGWPDLGQLAWFQGADSYGLVKEIYIGSWASEPEYCKILKFWRSYHDHVLHKITCENKPKNWHQTILSKDEYFHLYPVDDDGWIAFDGTERPSGYLNKMIDVKLSDGREMTDSSGRFEWDTDGPSRIVGHRLHKPECKPEFCESVTRSIPEPSAKPTIEQLAADYRNKLDCANRKQQEADDAGVVAYSALSELREAASALGLVAIADVMPAISGCMRLADSIPTRLQNHRNESIAEIGRIVNDEGLYHKIRDAFDLIK